MPTFELSPPPSTNRLFVTPRGTSRRFKTREYRAWIKGELNALLYQRAKPFHGRADVFILLPKGRSDYDNGTKATLDILGRAGILVDDNRKYVASVSITGGTHPTHMLVTIKSEGGPSESDNHDPGK